MTEKEWTNKAEKQLLGFKIVKVEYMTEGECEETGWDNRPLAIMLDNGSWLIPRRDDEGNDGGALTYIDSEGHHDIIPVLQVGR